MNVRHLQLLNGTIEEVTAVIGGVEQWGNQRSFKYRVEENVNRKDMWQREERDVFTKLSVSLELQTGKKYRLWLQQSDTSNADEAKPVDIVRPVYDLRQRFVHTVVEL